MLSKRCAIVGLAGVLCVGVPSVRGEIDPESIVAIWLCDEGEDVLVEDATGNGPDGMFVNMEGWTEDGMFGSALAFSGESGNHVEVPHDEDLSLAEWTITAWVKLVFPDSGDWAIVVVKDPANGFQNYSLDMNAGGQVYSEVTNGGSWSDCGSFTSIYDDEWHFIAASYDGATLRVYVDAVQEKEQSFGPGDVSEAPLAIGGRLDSSQPVKGIIDDIGLFSVALEEDDLFDLMDEGLTSLLVPPPDSRPRFRRGDVDDSGGSNITDAISTLNFLFGGADEPACLEAADIDNDGSVNISDPIRLLNFLFGGAAEPPVDPGEECGVDPDPAGSAGDLGCARSMQCAG